MRDPARIDGVLAELKAAWLANPDWRLGQLMMNTVIGPPSDLFLIEDAELVRRLRYFWTSVDGVPGGYPSGVDWNHGHD